MINKKINKRGDISILLLVIMTLILVGATLFIFNINLGKFETELVNIKSIDSVYVAENQISFYVNRALEDSIQKDISLDNLILNFETELGKYKDKQGNYFVKELKEIEERVGEIKIENNKIIFDLKDILIIRNSNRVGITYLYKKTFEKDL